MQYVKKLSLTLLILCGCSPQKEGHIRGIAMTMPYHIQIESSKRALTEKIACETFAHINATFNHFNPDSELSRFNRLPEETPFELSADLAHLFYLAKEISELSGRRYDPTAFELIALWKDALKKGLTPSDTSKISYGFDKLQLDGLTVTKKVAGLAIDFDSIAKGHAIDLIATRLKEAGCHNFLVEWGGEVLAHGKHPAGRPWSVLIEGEEKPITLTDSALATSGNRVFQYGTKNGLFTHLIDLETRSAWKIEHITQSTVRAASCALADALATTLLLFVCKEDRNLFIKEVEKTYPDVIIYNYEENTIF